MRWVGEIYDVFNAEKLVRGWADDAIKVAYRLLQVFQI